MYLVSTEFKEMSHRNLKENLIAYCSFDVNGEQVKIDQSSGLISIKVLKESTIASTCLAVATVNLIGDYDLMDKEVSLAYGYKIDGIDNYLNFGTFKVDTVTKKEGSNSIELICFDLMRIFGVAVETMDLVFPCTVNQLIEYICTKFNAGFNLPVKHGDFVIENEAYTNTMLTYREILEDIAEVTNSIVYFRNDVLQFRQEEDTCITLDESTLQSYDFQSKFGGINSLVLSRNSQEDNVYAKDDSDIEENGLFELKFSDNLLFDERRESVVDFLFKNYKDFSLYPFEAKTIGLGYLDLFDKIAFDVHGVKGETFITGSEIVIDSGISEVLFCNEIVKTSTQYVYATDSQKRQKRTELIVDKQQGVIDSIVEVQNENDIKMTQILQDMNEFKYTIQTGGGANLVKNSVGYGSKITDYWDVQEGSSIKSEQNSWNMLHTAKHGWKFEGASKMSQTVMVQLEEEYTVSLNVYKSNAAGMMKVYIVDDSSIIDVIDLKSGDLANGSFSMTFIPVSNKIKLVLECLDIPKEYSVDIDDVMISFGNIKVWQQATGETYTINVKMDGTGIMVKNADGKGYTTMTPQEFALYYDNKKLFTANKDWIEITKLIVQDGIQMKPIMMVQNKKEPSLDFVWIGE